MALPTGNRVVEDTLHSAEEYDLVVFGQPTRGETSKPKVRRRKQDE
jgi:hypothetical protein